jgi:YD repeat-containing protein
MLSINALSGIKHLGLLLGLLVFLNACSKDDQDSVPVPDVPEKSRKITSIEYNNDPTSTEQFTYDAQGRILKTVSSEDLITFEYNGNQVKITEKRPPEGNRQVLGFTGTLNAAGRLISGAGTSEYNQGQLHQDQYLFEYNAAGLLTKCSRISDNTLHYTYVYTYTGANLTKVETLKDGVLQYGYRLEYNAGIPNHWNFSPGTFLPLNNLTGTYSTQWPSKSISFWPDGTEKGYTNTFQLDSDGYVVRQTWTGPNAATGTSKYTYE